MVCPLGRKGWELDRTIGKLAKFLFVGEHYILRSTKILGPTREFYLLDCSGRTNFRVAERFRFSRLPTSRALETKPDFGPNIKQIWSQI